LNSIFYGGDLFFSGHTGLPFLAALAFWHIPTLRIFYLASTWYFGTVVLLGHYHYSIDVLAALFHHIWDFPVGALAVSARLHAIPFVRAASRAKAGRDPAAVEQMTC
jgi:hypothetical protein